MTATFADLRLPLRFWQKVDATGPCWEWTAARDAKGYARIRFQGRNALAYHVAYAALIGVVPEGMELDHLCRNRGCVNPTHLEPVTHAENVLRGTSPSAVHARKTHCPQGHPYAGDNLLLYRNRRRCRACKRARERRGVKS